MRKEFAFWPKTGTPLSEENHDEHARPQRAPISDEHIGSGGKAELTNGAAHSSTQTLACHFQRCHQRYHRKNCELYRMASLALTRLKRAASGTEQWNMYVWYALAERLIREGHSPEWMYVHVEPRCPQCQGPLTYNRPNTDGLDAQCATNCTDDNANRMGEIRETIAELYSRTFSQKDDVPLSTSDILVV